jgi:hypothetical protein
MYAFACLLIYQFVLISQLPDWLEMVSVVLLVGYFATAVISYFVHGIKQDTRNQLQLPEKDQQTPTQRMIPLYMWTLIAAEIGGFLVLFYGVIIELV